MTSNDDDQCAETLRLRHDYRALITQQYFEQWIDRWAEDGILEFPFALSGRRSRAISGSPTS